MRIPGFFRKEKGKEQALEFYSEARYTPEEFELGLQQCFEALGFKWLAESEFSADRWSECRKVLASKDLSRSEKESKITELLALPENELPSVKQRQEWKIRAEENRQKLTALGIGSSKLIDAVAQAEDRLGANAFDCSSHDWQWSGHNKARGRCPWHTSSTGTAAWIAPKQRGNGWGFSCATCTDNRQISAFTYWWYLKSCLGASYPKGREWY